MRCWAAAVRSGAVADRALMLKPLIAMLPCCSHPSGGSGAVSAPPALPNNTMRPPGATTSRSTSSRLVGALVCRVPGIVHLDVKATAVYDDVHLGMVGP
jgi:hypothetical protein